MLKKMTDYLQYLGVAGVMALLGCFPLSVSRRIAFLLGRAGNAFPCFGGLVRTNLRTAFPELPEEKIKELSAGSLTSLLSTILEFFWLHRHPDSFDSLVRFTPECEACGKRAAEAEHAVLITPHFGNWEFAGIALARHFRLKMATVVRTPRNEYLNRLITGGRMVENVRIIHSRGGMLKLAHAMAEGCCAGFLVDQNTRIRDGGMFIPFFGLPCPVSSSPARLARKYNAFVAVGGVVRLPDGTFEGHLRPLPKRASEYASEEAFLTDVMRLSEELIRKKPEQYLWMYKRFQYIPPEAPEELRKKYPSYAKLPPPSFFDQKARVDAHRRLAQK